MTEITRWQPINHHNRGIASINFRIGDITVRGAMFERHGTHFRVVMPYLPHRMPDGSSITAVGLSRDKYQAVQDAAISYYRAHYDSAAERIRYEDDAAGLRRVIGETLEAAGL